MSATGELTGREQSVDRPAGSSLIPHLKLDELLAELHGRLQAVLGTRDRVDALLEAVVGVDSELELEAVLRRIVEAAVELVDARSAPGGEMTLQPAPGRGTRIQWHVPLPGA
jgi:hypothetical protein